MPGKPLLDRSQPPHIQDPIDFKFVLPPLERQTLSNGIPLYWISAGVQEVVEIDWVFPAGIWQEPSPGVAQATARGIRWGTQNHQAREIDEILDFHGASLRQSVNNDYCTVSLFCLSRHLPALLPYLVDMFQNSLFPDSELEIYRRNTLQRLKVQLSQSEFVANQQIDAALFGVDHPYGRYTRPEILENLQREDLAAFWNQAYALSHVQIFMAGYVDEQALKTVSTAFGSLSLDPVLPPSPSTPPPSPLKGKQRLQVDEQGVQGSLRIGRAAPNRLDPDFSPMVMLNTVFGGYFGSRLMRNIREEKGYTYGIYSGLSSYFHGGTQIIQTEVGRDVIDDAIEEIYHEMQQLRDYPVGEEELSLVKNYLLGSLLADLDGPFEMLRRWRSLILYGLDADHFYASIDLYRTIDSQRIQEMAQRYYRPEEYVELVVV